MSKRFARVSVGSVLGRWLCVPLSSSSNQSRLFASEFDLEVSIPHRKDLASVSLKALELLLLPMSFLDLPVKLLTSMF